MGIDEAYLDISHSPLLSEEIANKIKERIQKETGLTCSIGIASNKLIAKIASDMQKPDGLTIIKDDDIKDRIWPLPVRKLIGVGPKTEGSLKAMGIHSIRELTTLSLNILIDRFGKSFGHYLYLIARGIDESPLTTYWEPKSIGREITFQNDLDSWQDIAKVLAKITQLVAQDMTKEGYKGQTVTVKIRFSDFETHTRAVTLQIPTISIKDLRRAGFECLKRFNLKKRVRLIGMRVSKLERIGKN